VGSGRISARNVLIQSNPRTIRYSGTIITSEGTTIVIIRKKKILSFPLNFSFANEYPARQLQNSVRATPPNDTITLLVRYCKKLFLVKILIYCSSVASDKLKLKS